MGKPRTVKITPMTSNQNSVEEEIKTYCELCYQDAQKEGIDSHKEFCACVCHIPSYMKL